MRVIHRVTAHLPSPAPLSPPYPLTSGSCPNASTLASSVHLLATSRMACSRRAGGVCWMMGHCTTKPWWLCTVAVDMPARLLRLAPSTCTLRGGGGEGGMSHACQALAPGPERLCIGGEGGRGGTRTVSGHKQYRYWSGHALGTWLPVAVRKSQEGGSL